MRIRWSEQEARKPYARPFMVTFTGDDGTDVGSVALNGADLLYYTQFQTAVLSLAGELFVDTAVEASADPVSYTHLTTTPLRRVVGQFARECVLRNINRPRKKAATPGQQMRRT